VANYRSGAWNVSAGRTWRVWLIKLDLWCGGGRHWLGLFDLCDHLYHAPSDAFGDGRFGGASVAPTRSPLRLLGSRGLLSVSKRGAHRKTHLPLETRWKFRKHRHSYRRRPVGGRFVVHYRGRRGPLDQGDAIESHGPPRFRSGRQRYTNDVPGYERESHGTGEHAHF
jgi:hypothetical protein